MSPKPKQEKPDLGRRAALAPTPTTLERRIKRAQTATADERDNALRLLRDELIRRGLSTAEASALCVERVKVASRPRGRPPIRGKRDETIRAAFDALRALFPRLSDNELLEALAKVSFRNEPRADDLDALPDGPERALAASAVRPGVSLGPEHLRQIVRRKGKVPT